MTQRMTEFIDHVEADEPTSNAVVRAVATAEGVEPIELETRLFDVVEPDALDGFFDGGRRPIGGVVRFAYSGYDVSVHADGRVTLTEI